MKHITLVAIALGVVFSIEACHRGWHGNPDKQVDWMASRVEKKLELRADQQAQYKALVDQVKTHIKARTEQGQLTMKTVKAEFNKETLDVGKLTALAKAKVRERPTPEQLDAFIDQVGAFYQTLDGKQQGVFAELVRDKLDWVD